MKMGLNLDKLVLGKFRRGDERILSLYWFILFVIVAIAIVSGVIMFYSTALDIRGAENSILQDKILGCLVENGNLKNEVFDKIIKNNNIENECGLIFSDESLDVYLGKEQYYVKIESSGNLVSVGNEDYGAYCGQEQSRKNIAYCSEKKVFVLDKNGEFVLLKITSAIMKVEQNAK